MGMSLEKSTLNLSESNRIFLKRAELYHSQLTGTRVGAIASCIVVAIIFWGVADHFVISIWLVIQLLVAIVRIRVTSHYDKICSSLPKLKKWVTLNICLSFVSGVTWGASSIIFFTPDQKFYPLALVIILLSTVSATSTADSTFPKVHHAYSFPVIFLLSFSFIVSGIVEFQLMSLLFVVFLIVNVGYINNNFKSTIHSIKLSIENEKLITELKRKKEKAEKENIEKSDFLAAASHDLRQPMHAQIGRAHV